MNEEKLFVDFLCLLQMYCREEHNIRFYAERIGCDPKTLSDSIINVSNKSFDEWINMIEIGIANFEDSILLEVS